jgi:predicted alpha/beta-fold hydrolase
MGKCMQNVIKRHAGALSKDPDTLMTKRVTAILAMKYPRGDEVDHIMMRFVGGTFPPFESAEAYYVCASSHKVLGDIRVPFLCINSADDPIVRTVPEDGAGNGYVVMSLTSGGGHLGWFEASDRLGEARSWIKKPVLEWLRTFGEDVVHEGQRGRPLHEVDGFLKEVGRDNIGCREVGDEAGYISGTRCQEGLLSGL